MRIWMPLLLLAAAALAGCASEDDTLRLAFVTTDDDIGFDKDPQRLADRIEGATGRPTTIHHMASGSAVLSAVWSGQVDAAFVDGAAAWLAWASFDPPVGVAAAELNSDGRSFYTAAAWVLDNQTFPDMASLEGGRSCHTGLFKSAGMFMPLGFLIGEGLAKVMGDADDVSAIQPTAEGYFTGGATIPASGHPHYNYEGALRCLSEGAGDVAFIKDITPAQYCDPSSPLYSAPAEGTSRDWCLPMDEYHMIQAFGDVPSHSVITTPGLAADKHADLVAALTGLAGDPDGQAILDDVLEAGGFVETDAAMHLGSYGERIRHVPGISGYVEGTLQ